MGLSKFFLNTGEALRPVLTKIIPMKLLSKMKEGTWTKRKNYVQAA